MTLADLLIEHGPFTPGDVILASFASRLLHVGDLNELRDELIAARKMRESWKRFQVAAMWHNDQTAGLEIRCNRCPWYADLDDDVATLAELNRRADEHTEECR